MSGDYCICSACGKRVLTRVFNSGAHDCPFYVAPLDGESFADFKARAEAIQAKLRAKTD